MLLREIAAAHRAAFYLCSLMGSFYVTWFFSDLKGEMLAGNSDVVL